MKKSYFMMGYKASLDKMAFPGVYIVKDLVSGDTNCFVIQVPIRQEGIPSYFGTGYAWIATTASGKFTGKLSNPWYKGSDTTPTVAQKIQATYETPEAAVAAYTAGEGRTAL